MSKTKQTYKTISEWCLTAVCLAIILVGIWICALVTAVAWVDHKNAPVHWPVTPPQNSVSQSV
jgi:hypothetical protein